MSNNTDFILRLELTEGKNISLIDLSSFLYDLELLYDFSIVTNLEEYEGYLYRYSTWSSGFLGRFWVRTGRPIKYEHKLIVLSLSLQSPGVLETLMGIAAAAKALVPFVDSAGKVADWRHNRNKAKYEAERAKTEAEKALIEKGTALYQQEIARTISEREQWRLSTTQLEYEISRAENRIIKRLQNNPIKLIDLSIPEERSRNDNDNELDN